MFGQMDQIRGESCCLWTMLAVYLTVLCSNLCIGDTISLPQTTFNTARTAVSMTTTTEASSASPSQGPITSSTVSTSSSTSLSTRVSSSQQSTANATVSSVNQEDDLDKEAVHKLAKSLNRTKQSLEPVIKINEVEKLLKSDSKDSSIKDGPSSRLISALSSSTTIMTPTTTMAAVNGTEGVSPRKVIIKGVAALTSPKASPKRSKIPNIDCKLLRRRRLPLPFNCGSPRMAEWN